MTNAPSNKNTRTVVSCGPYSQQTFIWNPGLY